VVWWHPFILSYNAGTGPTTRSSEPASFMGYDTGYKRGPNCCAVVFATIFELIGLAAALIAILTTFWLGACRHLLG